MNDDCTLLLMNINFELPLGDSRYISVEQVNRAALKIFKFQDNGGVKRPKH